MEVEMTTPSTVFVFSNGEYNGLSMQADGANLPIVADCTRKWTAVKAVPLTELGLEPFTTKARIAIANLTARGFHLIRVTTEAVVMPHAHRHSA
jgi:hypothetical protein